ncbi:hypothetical protein AB0H00_17855 [Nocardia sp. NPDC023852]|uniref:hypothetical protein n=1 Tax=Nocardia sp. NPDC023852 TaxID=3154697 RepID=UPI003410408A
MSQNNISEPNTFQVDPDRLREFGSGETAQHSAGHARFGHHGSLLDSPAGVAADLANLFRSWAQNPQDAIHTAAEVFGENQ